MHNRPPTSRGRHRYQEMRRPNEVSGLCEEEARVRDRCFCISAVTLQGELQAGDASRETLEDVWKHQVRCSRVRIHLMLALIAAEVTFLCCPSEGRGLQGGLPEGAQRQGEASGAVSGAGRKVQESLSRATSPQPSGALPPRHALMFSERIKD